MTTDSRFELIYSECGKTYLVVSPIIIEFEGKTLIVPARFQHDQYTVVPNMPDAIPAIAHDFAFTVRKWSDGTEITFCQANRMFYHLMKTSKDAKTRKYARLYYYGVSVGGWLVWNFGF